MGWLMPCECSKTTIEVEEKPIKIFIKSGDSEVVKVGIRGLQGIKGDKGDKGEDGLGADFEIIPLSTISNLFGE